eukprot:227147-Rhodomonas_salina.1
MLAYAACAGVCWRTVPQASCATRRTATRYSNARTALGCGVLRGGMAGGDELSWAGHRRGDRP